MVGTVSGSDKRQADMSPRSKLYFILAGLAGAVLAVVFSTQAQPAALTSPLALRQGEVRQVDRSLEFTVHTAAPVIMAELEPKPDLEQGGSKYICLDLKQDAPSEGEDAYGELICAGGSENAVGVTASGDQVAAAADDGTLEASVDRPEPDVLRITIPLNELGLPPEDYRFSFISSDGSCGSSPGDGCVDRLPEDGSQAFALQTPVLAGCRGADGVQLRYGPRDEKKVALTFDDGPSESTTPEILEILDEKRADGTFFMLGEAVEKNPDLARQITVQGNEVANHSMKHDSFPTEADLEETNDVIEQASGVRPCSFRPPYGRVDTPLSERAAGGGMNTVLWDVDTEDWTDWASVDSVVEGTRANVQPGSIILMHDGGDSRREKTIEALPRIIDELKADGYSFVTVSELLGNRIKWAVPGSPELP
jgi:peptidoglycan/xylan/chitin deacetylase (PgdA/CDA1 family)